MAVAQVSRKGQDLLGNAARLFVPPHQPADGKGMPQVMEAGQRGLNPAQLMAQLV